MIYHVKRFRKGESPERLNSNMEWGVDAEKPLIILGFWHFMDLRKELRALATKGKVCLCAESGTQLWEI